MRARTQYLLPDGLGAEAAIATLAAHLRLEAGSKRLIDRAYYDTFDGRLHEQGLLLVHADGRLGLLDGDRRELAAVPHPRRPRRLLVPDLPEGHLRELVAPVVEMRAVTTTAHLRSRLRTLRGLDDNDKTVVQLVLEEPVVVAPAGRITLPPRLHVGGVRGYGKELARARQVLEDELGLPAAQVPLYDEAVTAAGGSPGGVSSRLEVALRPDQRADSGAVALLQHLMGTIRLNLPGTLADVDSEFLHDLRVGVRRTRSAQRQLAGVFPREPLERFRGEFRWLQQVTGPTRDLDVYLLEVDEFRAALPQAVRPDLEPLIGLLAERRAIEQRRMVKALRSARTGAIFAEWPALLDGLVDSPLDDRPDAGRTIADLGGTRIAAVYRRIVKAGGAIDDSSPAEALHELRKTGKELRYLLEFFAVLFPGKVVKPMVRTLKALQDTLGRFQDREVQATMLRSLSGEVAALEGGPAALMAMGLLVERLEADQMAARAEFAERFEAFSTARQRLLVRETFA